MRVGGPFRAAFFSPIPALARTNRADDHDCQHLGLIGSVGLKLDLELILTHMSQKPVLRVEVRASQTYRGGKAGAVGAGTRWDRCCR